MSLASNNEFTEVFQVIVSVLLAFIIYVAYMGCDFASTCAGCS